MKLTLAQVIILLCILSCPCSAAEAVNPWRTDFNYQPPAYRPKIEARYTSAERTAFEIDAERYRMVVDLVRDSGQRIRSFKVNTSKGLTETLTGNGMYLQLTDSKGNIYSTLNTKAPSRINIYRRGPYYIETHWLDLQLTDCTGTTAPIKGEVVFYSYPEKTHVSVILHCTELIQVANASALFELDAESCASLATTSQMKGKKLSEFCLVKRKNSAPSIAFIYPVAVGIDDISLERVNNLIRVSNDIYNSENHDSKPAKWEKGHVAAGYFEILPVETGGITSRFESEVNPLRNANITAKDGRVLGYDPIRGCYTVQTDSIGDFNYYFNRDNNAYETASFSIKNDAAPRKIYVLHETRENAGAVECGVVLDSEGNTLPITVQTSKNFCGEYEEPFYNPKDTAFSETIFPVYLGSNETRKMTSLHLYQNWGKHMVKQISSLTAWMDYLHMSTGVTETTCYVPFLFGGLDGINIADFRPMSQKMWKDQPQHDNIGGHSFLRYADAEGWHYMEYAGSSLRSTGPNWAHMTMNYLSDDGKAKMAMDIFEFPQTDELRNFVHLRINFLDNICIKDSDLAKYVRILNISTWTQELRYTHVAYGGPVGDCAVVPIKLNDTFTLAGAALPTENAFAAIYPDKRGSNGFVVRRFEGKIGGTDVAPAVSFMGWNSAIGDQKPGDTLLSLVPFTQAKQIEAGDYLDIELVLMPYGNGTQGYNPAQKLALDYGVNAPKVTSICIGKKLADFPTRIALNQDQKADFTLAGGLDYIPIILEGALDYTSLRLYSMDGEKKTPIVHSREGCKDGNQVFVRENGTFGYVFLVKADGNEHRYVAE